MEIRRINTELQDMNKYIVEMREQERKNLGITIHDEILPYLSFLKLRISMIKAFQRAKERNDFIHNLMEETTTISENLKNISMELMPETPNKFYIHSAIESFANDFGFMNNLHVSCHLAPTLDMNYPVALLIFRVMKQALFNIAQHAEADTVDIKLKQNNNCFEFSVADNGKGITEQDIISKTSIGIRVMRDRVESMGGIFRIKAGAKKGTIVHVKLPKLK